MTRDEILEHLWLEQDRAFEYMNSYDSIPHHYGSVVLYQAEAYVIHEIGNNPKITVTELSEKLNKTKSAISQIIKKLINKGFVEQFRDLENRRIYHHILTSSGNKAYHNHLEFNRNCQKTTFRLLEVFTDEELELHIKVQTVLNKAYKDDVERSKEKWAEQSSGL